MKFILALISFLLGSTSVLAQMYMDVSDSTIQHQELRVTTLGDYGASSIKNAITNRFVFGGFIGSTAKMNSLTRHAPVNRIGVNATGEIIYRNSDKRLLKNRDWGLEVAAVVNYFGGVLYSRDAFGLAFMGNQSYVGDTLDLSGLDASFTGMQKVGFGLFDRKNKSGVRFNVYNISSRFNADFRDFEIRQSEDGQEVGIVMDGEVTLQNSANFSQGIGAGFDFDFRVPISWVKGNKAFLQVKGQNLGFAYMHQAQRKYQVDTTIIFDGFTFGQLVADNGYFSDSINILDTLGVGSTDVNPFFLLPGYVQVAKMLDKNSDQKLQSFFGLRVYPSLIFSPLGFAGADYRINEHIHAGASITFGGFTGLRVGAYGQFDWERISLGLGSDNFSGFMRSGGNGTSLYINLACRF